MPTVTDLVEIYLTDYLPRLRPNTQRSQTHCLEAVLAEFGPLELRALTPAMLADWRNRLRDTYGPGTVRLYLHALSSALRVAVCELYWLQDNPMARVSKPSPEPGRVRYLTDEERPRLLAECQASHNPALYTIVLMALGTGMRKSEILTLRWEAIDLGASTIRLCQTKNGTARGIPLPQVVREVLQQWWAQRRLQTPWVFPDRRGEGPTEIGVAWDNARQRAGLPDFRFHDLRHTCASYLAMNGASLREIAEVLGHKSLAVTMRYSHLSTRHIAGVVNRMAIAFLSN